MNKIDRAPPRSVTGSRPAQQTERAQTAQTVSAPAAVEQSQPITHANFEQLARELTRLHPELKHVARSADPGQLWGSPPPEDRRMRFVNASPAERAAMAAQLKAEIGVKEEKIADRTGKLEKRWRRMNGGKRQEILQQYVEKGGTPPQVKAEVVAANKQAAAMQAEIDALAAKLKATYPAKTPAEDQERRALKRELVELRQHQREVLNAATDKLGETGQKLELLATNEQNIDPKGTITKGDDSLLSMIGQWLGLVSTQTFFDHFLEQNKLALEDQKKRIEAETLEKTIAEGDLKRKQQIKTDVTQRENLRQLAERIDGIRKG